MPGELRVANVWPGKTLAVLYCASYESPSVIQYHELILAPALVSAGGRIGFWISDIYVDDPLSQAGGRSIWGLPKELATFAWEAARREVSVRAGAQLLCRIQWSASRWSWPVPIYLPAVSRLASRFVFFSGRGSASAIRTPGDISIPTDSPLAQSGFESSRTLAVGERLRLTVGAPRPLA